MSDSQELAKEVILDYGKGTITINGELFKWYISDEQIEILTPGSVSVGMVLIPMLVDPDGLIEVRGKNYDKHLGS